MGWASWLGIGPAIALVASAPAGAQVVADVAATTSQPLQSLDEAIAQDAAAVAERLGLSPEEAARRLRLQEASVPTTDAIAARYAGRLAGIAIEHQPEFAIVVRLTGDAPAPDEMLTIAGVPVRIIYLPGARASHVELVQAITAYQVAIRESLLRPPALGVDQRSGELVAVVSSRDSAREGAEPLRARLTALTRVPVRLRVVDEPTLDMGGIAGGARLVGSVPDMPHRFLCTAGFVVTDGERTALATAAHCPDALSVRDAANRETPLPLVGEWGWGNQDVQINASPEALAPVFFPDTAQSVRRPVEGARSRAGTRAGDIVCHRGERSGYSCAQVELTDFAPAGDLCGGACLPTWTTVAGPTCKSGDSGGPVFLGNTAFGILKGGSYRSNGSCAFYFYMSIDYLPAGWRLSVAAPSAPSPAVPIVAAAPL